MLHWDPAIRRGVLANGLRYAVMRNATPGGGLSLRLGIDVGSFEETDQEQGAAHFVEHLAFGGDRTPEGSALQAAFAAAGVAFGRDRNATTDYYATIYRIDLPHRDPEVVNLAFGWLRSVALGAQLGEAEVASERGVIESEREARMTPQDAERRQISQFETPGLRYLDREPIGTPQSLEAMTTARLRAFYSRWYRPDNAVVVIVGDQPLEELQRAVEAAFGDWKAVGPPPERAKSGTVDAKRTADAFVMADPSQPTTAGACRLRSSADWRPAIDLGRMRDDERGKLWVRILQDRLAKDIHASKPMIVGASLTGTWQTRELDGFCLQVTPVGDDWRAGLAVVEAQLSRLALSPPSEDELEVAIKEKRALLRGAADEAGTRQSADLATTIVRAGLTGNVVPAPSEAFRMFDAAVADTTPGDIAAAFARDWAGAGPLVLVVGPTPPTKAEVLAAWSKPASIEAAVTPPAAVTWPYDFGRPGRVVRRWTYKNPDFTRVVFANGVVVNLMHTDFEQKQERVAVIFGDGRREIADPDRLRATLGAQFFERMGLGRLDAGQVAALYAEQDAGAKLAIGNEAFVLSGEAIGADGLNDELRLLTAEVSDPGFRSIDPLLSAVVEVMYRSYRTHPALVVGLALNSALAPDGPMLLPPKPQLAATRTADFERILKPALTQDPLEVGIVGDVDIEAAIQSAATTFGALPPRRTADRRQAHTWYLRFPDHPIPPIAASHDGPKEQAIVGVIWPLYVATPARRREEYALGLVADLLTEAMRHRLRDELSKTYSPEAETEMPDNADQGFLLAAVLSQAGDAELVAKEAQSVAKRLASGDFTDAELEAVRAPRVARLSALQRTNAYWVGAIARSDRDSSVLEDVAEQRDLYASITLAEVRKAAADWLSQAPIVVTALPSAGGGAAP